jgi:hypothetical protein
MYVRVERVLVLLYVSAYYYIRARILIYMYVRVERVLIHVQ